MSLIITLVIIAIALFVVEIIVPGGILAVIAVLCLFGAAVASYEEYGMEMAVFVFFGACILSLGFFILEMKLIKSGPFRKFISSESSIQAVSNAAPDPDMVGRQGTALTTMAPSGRVRVGERNFDASSQAGYIQKNTAIEVVRIENAKLIVKPLS